MDVPDFRTVTVEALAAMVRDRTLTAAAVTEHALERIEALNGVLNAFVAVDADAARSEAAAIDARIDAGDDVGPLAGVPIGVKDLVDATGFHTSKGAMYTRGAAPAVSDCTEVARLRAAGCVVLGKTNTPEHGCMGDTYNPRFGATLNPWHLERSPGGSSGGTGAAIAAGHGPGGHRLRRGRLDPDPVGDMRTVGPQDQPRPGAERSTAVGPDRPVMRGTDGATHPRRGPVSRCGGRPPIRPTCAACPRRGFPGGPRSTAPASRPGCCGLRRSTAGRSTPRSPRPARPRWTVWRPRAPRSSRLRPRSARCPGVFLQLFFGGLIGPVFRSLYGTDEWANVTDVLALMLEDAYERVTAVSLYEARQQAGEMSVALAEAMDGYDVLLMPTLAGQAPAPGGHGTINGEETPNWFRFTPLANLTRRPAGTVCCGFSREGVPIGLQVMGHQLDDLAVLETLAVIEDLLALDPIAPDVAP